VLSDTAPAHVHASLDIDPYPPPLSFFSSLVEIRGLFAKKAHGVIKARERKLDAG